MEIYLDDIQKESTNEINEDFIYIEDIAQGAFGKVIHAKEKITNKDISVKIIDLLNADEKLTKKVKDEISILKKLDHENIVKFYGQIEKPNQLLIKMEYIKYGTLSEWMNKHKKVTEEEASLILKKVLSVIDYLHNNHICHRDIKPENIMLSRENDLNSIKIIDFGLSTQNFESLYNSDYCGTFIYMAPEEIERKSYYLSVDIWSVGILMYMLLNKGEHPFYHKGDTKEDFINNLRSIKELKSKCKISYMAMNLLKKLLEPDPIKRYKATDALKHPWITRNPDDKIPQTFNDLLNNDNIINNARQLMMMSIFLNYIKVNSIYNNMNKKRKNYENNKIEEIIDNIGLKRKKKKNGIYKINDNYIKKCEYISKMEKNKIKQLREKYLDVSSTEEDSDDKNNNNSNSINSNINSNINFNFNSNLNFSNLNISSAKDSYTNKEHHNYRIFNGISNTSRDNPIILLDSKKNKSINNIGLTEQKRCSIKMKHGKSLFLKNLENESNNNINFTNKAISKKGEYPNISRSTTKDNITNNLNVFNYLNNNINNIKPINLFLNNNITQVKTNKCNDRININNNIPLVKNNNKKRKDNSSKHTTNPLKLPIIYSKNNSNKKIVKNYNRLLSFYN
jgi:serine/threonine protein kinase